MVKFLLCLQILVVLNYWHCNATCDHFYGDKCVLNYKLTNIISYRLHSRWESPERSMWLYPRYGALNAESDEDSVSVRGFKLLISYFLCTACNSTIVRSLTGALCFAPFVPLSSFAVLGGTVRDKHTAAFVIERILFAFGTKITICRPVWDSCLGAAGGGREKNKKQTFVRVQRQSS